MSNREDTSSAHVQDGDQPHEPFTIHGRLKWFNVSKGYGFIRPDRFELGDILLTTRCLREGGVAIAIEGTRVVCEVQRGRRGLQAIRILSFEPPSPAEDRQRDRSAAYPPFEQANVKWLDRTRGFGFLTRPQSAVDVFVHVETLKRCGVVEMVPGQPMLVRVVQGLKGPMVIDIQPDEPVSDTS